MGGTVAARWRRRVVALALLLLPVGASAQTQVLLPPSLVAPNYNRVFPGLGESIQAGASLVRTGTPPAIWYNPAGMVLGTRTQVNASVQGYQMTLVSGSVVLNGGSQEGNIGTVPTFVGIVLGEEAIHLKDVRFGFGVANDISWSQGLNSATQRPNSAKVLYGTNSEIQQYQGIAAVSYAMSEKFRLGFSLAVPYTYVSNNGELNGTLTERDSLTTSVRTVTFSGWNFHLLPKAGFQWDALDWLSVGGVVAPPALRVLRGGDFTLVTVNTTTTGASSNTRQASIRDTSATFSYVLPAEISGGLAFRFGPVEFEVDAHWFVAVGTYNLIQSSSPVVAVNAAVGTPPGTTVSPFPTQIWGTRNVVDLNVGGSVKVSKLISLLVGFYSDHAPGNVPSKVFLPVSLYGVRAGISFNSPSLSGSVGLGYEWGSASIPLTDDTLAVPVNFTETMNVTTLSLLFAISYTF
jgi:hypothetical protein